MNKEEVEFNSRSLVSVWMEKYKDLQDLRLVFNNGTASTIIPCTRDNAGIKLSEVLCNNEQKFTKVSLLATVNRMNKILGNLDIK